MAEEGEDLFVASLQKALTFLAKKVSRELRQEQKSSVKQLFTGGCTCCAPHSLTRSSCFAPLWNSAVETCSGMPMLEISKPAHYCRRKCDTICSCSF